VSFSSDISKARTNIKKKGSQKFRALCLELGGSVIKRTPVGNPELWEAPPPPGYIGGTLRNSWFSTIGTESNATGRSPDAGGGDSNTNLLAVTGNLDMGETFVLKNPQPYARAIEEGWSGQSPQGMVRVTASEFQSKAKVKFSGGI